MKLLLKKLQINFISIFWTISPRLRNWLPNLQCHRGYCTDQVTENTLEAIQLAYKMGYKICEFDVQITKDFIVVLFHDEKINEKKISDLTFLELKLLQKSVCKLEDIFSWVITTKDFKLNIEIKSKNLTKFILEENLCKLIYTYKIKEKILVSSFNPLSLYSIKTQDPEIYRALLVTYEKFHENNIIVRWMLLNFICKPHMLNLRFLDYSKNSIKYKIFSNLNTFVPVVLWTVNDLKYFNENKLSIHGIISDKILPNEI